ncbi:hypothetical protein NDU88_012057 [Pleurodeles waltl]|uniref:Uncharacterized protein n=1 Tax=Pleurodeles waltl TaxID=8319 RepID=A0AAV7R4V6_PLEWA|nr:hypothetical protein NDU88_012057 [Pleurodeles waltl]
MRAVCEYICEAVGGRWRSDCVGHEQAVLGNVSERVHNETGHMGEAVCKTDLVQGRENVYIRGCAERGLACEGGGVKLCQRGVMCDSRSVCERPWDETDWGTGGEVRSFTLRNCLSSCRCVCERARVCVGVNEIERALALDMMNGPRVWGRDNGGLRCEGREEGGPGSERAPSTFILRRMFIARGGLCEKAPAFLGTLTTKIFILKRRAREVMPCRSVSQACPILRTTRVTKRLAHQVPPYSGAKPRGLKPLVIKGRPKQCFSISPRTVGPSIAGDAFGLFE